MTGAVSPLPVGSGGSAPPLADLLGRPGTGAVLLAGSKDPNAKVTVVLLDAFGPSFVVKVPTTGAAAEVVRSEGALLDGLTELGLGSLATTLPRPVGYLAVEGLPALVSTALTGTPMSVRYHAWRHTARRRRVRADFAAAGRWLADLQRRTAGPPAPVTLLADSIRAIEARFPGHSGVSGLRRHAAAAARLSACSTPRTVVHGDYWFGNLLLERGRVAGVVDWECGSLRGEPLRDVARFAVSYALYLDRHVRPGRRIPGHRGLRAGTWGVGVVHAWTGRSWFGRLVRRYLTDALERLELPGDLWQDILVAGVADVVATADHPDFALSHLDLLLRLVPADAEPEAPEAISETMEQPVVAVPSPPSMAGVAQVTVTAVGVASVPSAGGPDVAQAPT